MADLAKLAQILLKVDDLANSSHFLTKLTQLKFH